MKRWYADLVFWLTIAPRLKRLQWQFPEAKIFPFGSRYVCNPLPLFTDIDFMVYASMDDIKAKLIAYGYEESIHTNYSGQDIYDFTSWRKGIINLIVSPSKTFVERDLVATHMCKSWNVQRKWGRILVHEAIRGNMIDASGTEYLPKDLVTLLTQMNGPHRVAMYEIYRAQHDLRRITDE